MVKEAERNAAGDRERKAAVEAHNLADSAVYSAEKFLREQGEQIPQANRSAMQSQIEAVRSALAGNASAEHLKSEVDKLQAVMQEAGAAMYQQGSSDGATSGQTQGGPSGPAAGDEDIIEGEYSEG